MLVRLSSQLNVEKKIPKVNPKVGYFLASLDGRLDVEKNRYRLHNNSVQLLHVNTFKLTFEIQLIGYFFSFFFFTTNV